ncbi:MAG TPA: nucleotide exchange factor GrpE [Thermomicrobiales bacterium]|nr:nucleotide exchange factor GrpE [Thermomicrobiales bacterium]
MTSDQVGNKAPVGEEDLDEIEVPEFEEAEPEDELARAISERDDYLDQLQRSRAEFINFRRRTDQERTALRPLVTRDVVSQFLPVVDDLDRAIEAIPAEDRETGWVKGVEMIQSKLASILERLGVTRVESLGQPFDPSVHEAIGTQPGSSGSTVVQVFQEAYRIGDLLVRPAMVMTGDPIESHEPQESAATFNA